MMSPLAMAHRGLDVAVRRDQSSETRTSLAAATPRLKTMMVSALQHPYDAGI